MDSKKEFKKIKNNLIRENDKKYGKEIREKYGENAVNKSYSKVKNMTEERYNDANALSRKMMENLKKAYELKDPTCEFAQKAVELHKEWLCIFYDGYCKEYHLGLADMYVEDERFRKNYDIIGKGAAEFLRDAIRFYFKNSSKFT